MTTITATMHHDPLAHFPTFGITYTDDHAARIRDAYTDTMRPMETNR